MVWWHVGIAALALVLAALGAVVALRGRATTPVVFLALTGLLFVGLYGAAWFLVLPDEPARRVAGAASTRAALEGTSAGADDLESVLGLMTKATAAPPSEPEKAKFRATVNEVALRHAPRASDVSVVQLVRVATNNLEELLARDPALCYAYAFPQRERVVDFSKYLSASAIQSETDALRGVLQSASSQPQQVPAEAEVGPAVQAVGDRLARRFGRDAMTMIERAGGGTSDPKAVCTVFVALFREFLALPVDQRGPALRFFLASAARTQTLTPRSGS
jgi:hypothetical protein